MPLSKLNIFDNTGIDQSTFFKQYWHKSPVLLRNAIDPGQLDVLPDKSKLLQLSCHQDIQSRIVLKNTETDYDVEYGPFIEDDLDSLGEECWNLLVSDIDKWQPKSRAILKYFTFIRQWMFDDMMLSCGSVGGTVGPHTDHYDVFLLQAQGQRKWQYSYNKIYNPELIPNQSLKVMSHFKADQHVTLNPGDILYIPPEVAHYGIAATDDCVTCSIGTRTPSHAELLTSYVDKVAQSLSENKRFEEPEFTKQPKTGEITHSDLNNIKDILTHQLDINDSPLIDWFGKYISEYRSIFYEYNKQPDKTFEETNKNNEKYTLVTSPYSKSCYFLKKDQATLFVNGEKFRTSLKLAELICNDGLLFSSHILNLDQKDKHIIDQLFATGALIKSE